MKEESFLCRMLEEPDDLGLRLVFADWLEEQGDRRAELLRLSHALTQRVNGPDRQERETHLRALVAAGVQPVGPRWTNSLGMHFTWVPPGVFLLGSSPQEPEHQEDEAQRQVTLTEGFYLGVHPVTQAQWRAVMGNNPSCFPGDDRPVEGVSWDDCQEFCQALRQKDGLPTRFPSPYRLPTEAEWEYACRAGTTSAFYFGDRLSPEHANYHVNYGTAPGRKGRRRQETTPVGSYPPNAWGLTDMHGNVYEWCADWYSVAGTEGPGAASRKQSGGARVLRGGSWHSLPERCRSACRGWGPPGYRGSDVGCRVCFRMDYSYTI